MPVDHCTASWMDLAPVLFMSSEVMILTLAGNSLTSIGVPGSLVLDTTTSFARTGSSSCARPGGAEMALLHAIKAHAYTLVQIRLTGHLPFVSKGGVEFIQQPDLLTRGSARPLRL